MSLPEVDVKQQRLAIWYCRLICLIFIGAIPFAFLHAPLASMRNWQILLTTVFILLAIRYKFTLHHQHIFPLPAKEFKFLFISSLSSILYAVLSKFLAFRVNAWDFSIFDQMLYYTLHGKFMYNNICECNHFAYYPNYLLILLVPLHALFASPLFLVIVHGLMAWSGVFPLFKLARLYLKNDFLIALAIISYLTNSWTGSIIRYSFHPEVFFIPLGLYFLYGWKKEKTLLWVVSLAGFLLIKTDAAFYSAAFATAELLFTRRKRIPSAFILLTSLAFLALNLLVAQPYFGHSIGKYDVISGFWGKYGHSLPEVLIGMLGQPWLVLKDVLTSEWYIFFGAFLFLPFLSRANLFALLPAIFILGTSSSKSMSHYGFYYSAPLMAFTFGGLLHAWEKLKNRKLGMTIFLAALLLSPLLSGGYMKFRRPDIVRLKVLGQIKKDYAGHGYKVYAQSSLLPHLPYDWEARPLDLHCFQKRNTLIITNPKLKAYPFSHKDICQFNEIHKDKIHKLYPADFRVFVIKPDP